jgi:hypothetical protein
MFLRTKINLLFIILIALLLSFVQIKKDQSSHWSEYELMLIDVVPLEVVMEVAVVGDEPWTMCEVLTLEQWMSIQDHSLDNSSRIGMHEADSILVATRN